MVICSIEPERFVFLRMSVRQTPLLHPFTDGHQRESELTRRLRATLRQEHNANHFHRQGARDGSVSGSGGFDQRDGVRDLSRRGSVAHAKEGPGGGDGQPLKAHKAERVRDLIEGKGCQLLYLLPPYSPDFNPIEGAFCKLKSYLRAAGVRSQDTLMEVIGKALSTISVSDACGYFEHCGYRALVQSL
jgi:hypothetical protein